MDFIRKDGRIDIDTENENLANKNQSLEVFSFENCNKLKKELLNLGLSLDTIEKVIVKSPVILLYSNQLDSVYYLFKNKKYCGYTILDDDKYVTYLLNENIKSNVIFNNYVTDNMLKYYKVNDYKKEVFDSLENQFKLKNYYFKISYFFSYGDLIQQTIQIFI